MNMGGPSTLEEVRPFLRNLFSDPMIIELPGGAFLRPLFSRMISTLRSPKVRRYYGQIGGGSPLLRLTQEQAAGSRRSSSAAGMSGRGSVIAMRYTEPGSAEAVRTLQAHGERRAVALAALSAGVRRDHRLEPRGAGARRAIGWAPALRDRADPQLSPPSGYLEAIVGRIRETLERLDAESGARR